MELRKRLTQIPLEQRREARPTMPKSLDPIIGMQRMADLDGRRNSSWTFKALCEQDVN